MGKILKKEIGITLIALIITIILLLILGGVVISQLNRGNIIENTISVAEQAKIASKKEEIELAIINKMTETQGDITIEDIIGTLEKEGIIDIGNSNSESGQVKTNPDGYVYEIVEDDNGNWEVNYVGKGEIEKEDRMEGEITIAIKPDTPTNQGVVATITFPTGNYKATKEITLEGGMKDYIDCTGVEIKEIEIIENCTIKARIIKGIEEIKSATLEVTNIDKTNPTVNPTESSVKIEKGESHEISGYFTITPNGTTKVTNVTYKDENGNNIQNTNTLEEGTHTITCTAQKETGAIGSGTITIEIYSNSREDHVFEDMNIVDYPNSYKISKIEKDDFFACPDDLSFWEYLERKGIENPFIVCSDNNDVAGDVKEEIEQMYEEYAEGVDRESIWQDICEKMEYELIRSNIYTFTVIDLDNAIKMNDGKYEVCLYFSEIPSEWENIHFISFDNSARSIEIIDPISIDRNFNIMKVYLPD